ncbi:MAG TPA: multidrug efflux RND transporter permease subunit [Polyangia bacterium]|nr:multidrug efflux RND transporter permease subunit [Polyangia bacterium]
MGEFFVRRPIVAIVLSIVTVLLGVIALRDLPISRFPDIVPPEIQVNATFTGADAVTVEQSVATPLEQQINGVDNMLYMRSINSNDGTIDLRITFAVGTDVNTDNVLVNNRIAQANAQLPNDVRVSGVNVRKATTTPTLLVALHSPRNTRDATFLGNYNTINLRDALLRVPGVGLVNTFGAADYAMRIWVNPDKLARLGLTVADLSTAVQKQSTVNPAGQVGAEPAPPGQEFTYNVRAEGRLTTPEEFAQIVVRENPDGSLVRLADVSRIELGAQTYKQIARYNGSQASLMAVYQAPGSNALDVKERVSATLQELSAQFPDDVAYTISLDTTLAVQQGISEIVETLLAAVLLVLLVVYVFLQSWRATLIPLLTVPVSLIGAFAVFPLLGFSVNTLSLFGLMLAIGLVVDDAIVVVEAVEHHIEQGMSPRDATVRAMKEVTGPVVAIALILAAVFIPVAFIGGVTGRLYQQFALTIAISVLISAFNALTLSPALCSMLLKPRASGGLLGRAFGGFNRAFDATRGRYLGLSRSLARRAVLVIVLLAAFTGVAVATGRKLPTGFIPEEDLGYMYVNVQLPDAASLQRTDEVCKQVESILASTDGIESYSTIAGFSLVSRVSASYNGFFFVTLKPWAERTTDATKLGSILKKLNGRLAAMPQARAFAFTPPAIPGIGTAGGFSFMLQDRRGGTVQELESQIDRFLQGARKRPEIGTINSTFSTRVPQIYVQVDREKALKQGVDIADLYATLQAFMGSAYVNDFNRFGRQWRVYLAADPAFRTDAADMGKLYVRNKLGQSLPLSTLVKPVSTNGPEFTNRFNLFRSAELTGGAAPGYSSGQAMTALEEVARDTLAVGYGYSWNALSYQQKVAPSPVPTFVLAIIVVFLILAAQYESWSLPFSVLLGTPIAVMGAFTGLAVAKLELNVYGQIGLIMLIGLSAKNAILIVEFAKAERERGKPALEAALAAAKLRLRPILMTAFAFILGCAPLLIAGGAGGISRRMLGVVVVFGMLAATLLGVFLTPALFVMVDRLAQRKRPAKVVAAPVVEA